MSNDTAIAMASLTSSLHMMRIMANRGLVSPNEVETIHSMITETLETMGSPELSATMMAPLDPVIAEVREFANKRWIGKGKTDPA